MRPTTTVGKHGEIIVAALAGRVAGRGTFELAHVARGPCGRSRFRWAGRTIIQAELPYRPRALMRRRSSRLLATRTSTYAQHIDVRGTGCHPRGCNTAYPIKSLFSASISFPRESFFKIRRTTIGAGEFPSLAAQIHPLPIQCLVGLARYFSRVSLSGIRNATNAGHIVFAPRRVPNDCY